MPFFSEFPLHSARGFLFGHFAKLLLFCLPARLLSLFPFPQNDDEFKKPIEKCAAASLSRRSFIASPAASASGF
jgi:hypothetical protein